MMAHLDADPGARVRLIADERSPIAATTTTLPG